MSEEQSTYVHLHADIILIYCFLDRIQTERIIWRVKSYLEKVDKGFVLMDRQIESFNDRLLGVGLSRFHCLGYNKRHKWIEI